MEFFLVIDAFLSCLNKVYDDDDDKNFIYL